jgi:hypothetical protein
MCERVTVGALATTDVTAGQTRTRRTVQSALRARGAVHFKRLAIYIVQMWTIAGFYTGHNLIPQSPRRIFIAVSVFFINIATVSGPTPPGTGVR